MSELKNSVDSFSISLNQLEERMIELEDRSVAIIQSEKQIKKNENEWRKPIGHKRIPSRETTSIHIIGTSEGEGREKRIESLWTAIIANNCPNPGEIWISKFMKLIGHPTTSIQWPCPRHIKIKLSKIKGREF